MIKKSSFITEPEYGRDEKCKQNLGLKTEGKRPLGRPRHRCEDNIKIDLRELGWECMDWIRLTWNTDQWRTLVNTVINLRVDKGRRVS
jgi:hypothetical protein